MPSSPPAFALPPIAVVEGDNACEVQRCLARFVETHRAAARIVGVVEIFGDGQSAKAQCLRSVRSGEEFALFEDRGCEAAGCNLMPGSVVEAAEAVCRDIELGCDLVVLSKFGKLEAEHGSGLVPAFVAALDAGAPVLAAVSRRFSDAWGVFAAKLYTVLPCDDDAIAAWWSSLPVHAA